MCFGDFIVQYRKDDSKSALMFQLFCQRLYYILSLGLTLLIQHVTGTQDFLDNCSGYVVIYQDTFPLSLQQVWNEQSEAEDTFEDIEWVNKKIYSNGSHSLFKSFRWK